MCVSFAHLMLAFIEISLVCVPLVGIKLLYAKRTQEFFCFRKTSSFLLPKTYVNTVFVLWSTAYQS